MTSKFNVDEADRIIAEALGEKDPNHGANRLSNVAHLATAAVRERDGEIAALRADLLKAREEAQGQRRAADHFEVRAQALTEALRAIAPYAESRIEDMGESTFGGADDDEGESLYVAAEEKLKAAQALLADPNAGVDRFVSREEIDEVKRNWLAEATTLQAQRDEAHAALAEVTTAAQKAQAEAAERKSFGDTAVRVGQRWEAAHDEQRARAEKAEKQVAALRAAGRALVDDARESWVRQGDNVLGGVGFVEVEALHAALADTGAVDARYVDVDSGEFREWLAAVINHAVYAGDPMRLDEARAVAVGEIGDLKARRGGV